MIFRALAARRCESEPIFQQKNTVDRKIIRAAKCLLFLFGGALLKTLNAAGRIKRAILTRIKRM